VSLQAGSLVTALGITLNVTGSISLNNTPLVITGNTTYGRGTGFTIVKATASLSGKFGGVFAGLGSGSFIVLGTTRYLIGYSNTAMTLTSTGPSTGPR
jgi:hypothetical protein